MKYKVEVEILGGDYCRDACGDVCDFFWESEDGDTGCCLLNKSTFIEGDISNVPKYDDCPSLILCSPDIRIGNWKGEIFAWWDHPVTNAYTEAIAGLVKLTNHTGRGYSFKAIRAKLLYSNLPTFHRPVFDRSLKERPPFMTLGEIKDYGIKFSTLYQMLEGG